MGVVGEVGVRRVVGGISEFDSEMKGKEWKGLFICLKEKGNSCGVYRGDFNQRPGVNDNDLTMASRVLEERIGLCGVSGRRSLHVLLKVIHLQIESLQLRERHFW